MLEEDVDITVEKLMQVNYYFSNGSLVLPDTGEDSKLVHRRKRPKVDKLFSSFFSDASERRV